MQPMREENPSHHDHLAAAGPAVDVHGRVVTAKRRAAARYRQAQRAADSAAAATALRLAVDADPAFGLAVADLDAITGTASQVPGHQQMNWERHHIEVVRAAATGNARRAADLLREHLASIGCDPLAFRITAMLRQPAGKNDDFENLGQPASRLPRNPMAMPAMTAGHPPATTQHSESETPTGYAHRTKGSGHDNTSDRFCKRSGATRRSPKDRRGGGSAVPLVHGHLLHR